MMASRRALFQAAAGTLLLAGAAGTGGCGQSVGPLSAASLPPYASRTRESLAAYRFAVAQPGLLARLPCYCNCADFASHQNLRDCFASAAGTFTDHAAYCQVCQDETLDAKRMQAQGLAVAEIRRRIDTAYAARGRPTNTPPVE